MQALYYVSIFAFPQVDNSKKSEKRFRPQILAQYITVLKLLTA